MHCLLEPVGTSGTVTDPDSLDAPIGADDHHRWDPCDPEKVADGVVLVWHYAERVSLPFDETLDLFGTLAKIDGEDFQLLALKFVVQLLKTGHRHQAGAAPFGPEIYQNRALAGVFMHWLLEYSATPSEM